MIKEVELKKAKYPNQSQNLDIAAKALEYLLAISVGYVFSPMHPEQIRQSVGEKVKLLESLRVDKLLPKTVTQTLGESRVTRVNVRNFLDELEHTFKVSKKLS